MRTLKRIFGTLLVLLIFAAAVIAVFYFHFNKETKELSFNIRKGTPGSYVELSHGVTHYELDGQDTGKVVVLLHGFSVPYYIWNGTFEHLVDAGFRVLRYDEYGRGYSDRPDIVYNNDAYLDQLKELIAKLDLTAPVSLVGVSFGGAVATDFTNKYPDMVDKVILIDPVYDFTKPAMPELATEFKETFTADDRAKSQLEDFKYPERHPDWVDEYLDQMQYKGFRHAIVSTQYHYKFNARQAYAELNSKNKKVMLAWGREDTTVPFTYSDSVRSVLKTEFLPVDDAKHLPYMAQPEIVNPALVTFLKK
ncbi:alpha/beta fold hydrolase [Mucilaginibacter segetis]|uniref:Alpha/beta hydrolase n=1 Tax=Mucilaginibacter segetis TaxID=2793071 RepID=A0A934UNL7_9SPHI|nr:alpha/beta hydrolase [Mucilaginibacter segetis]MBK0380933.1 alpha/beta hydrolase [Mucilaginibacter segetis]